MQEKKMNWLNEIVSFLGTLIVSFVLVFLFTSFIAKPVRVEGNSMYPTLHDEDVAFANLINVDKKGIQRFDIVVIYLENQNKYIVKRIIGLPNETIEVKDDVLYVDGVEVQENFLNKEYVTSQSQGGIFTHDIDSITLGDDEVYCLGDNRLNSQDSRYYGPFQFSQIVSKHLLVIYPLNHTGFIN